MPVTRYDPVDPEDPAKTVVAEDVDLLQSHYIVAEAIPERMAPWVLRIELDRSMMVDKKLSMEKGIGERIKEEYQVN